MRLARRTSLWGVLFALALSASAEAKLRAPGLQAPAAGQRSEAMPKFTWARVAGAEQYEFQLAADEKFGSIVLGRGRGSFRTDNTAATIQDTLPAGTYFWRVRAIGPKDSAGRWSPVRSFERAWDTAPQLLEPGDALSVAWPASPLVLRWSRVPRATKYLVTIATDASLANPVVGTVNKPVETQGTVFALPTGLAAGRYYWAVTPVDGGGHRGARSRVGAFTWTWPSTTPVRVIDLNPAEQVFDPLLEWDGIPGAARYEVEVNFTEEFTPGSKVYGETVIGTSVSPRIPLPNNSYHWRVRAIDAQGHGGAWNVGSFRKEFDDVTPTVANIRVRDHDTVDLGSVPTTSEPVLTWDPVPGATGYELQFTKLSDGGCNWTARLPGIFRTPNPAWAWTADSRPVQSPGPSAWPQPTTHDNPLSAGSWCVRILAIDPAANISEWTYVNGQNQAAFVYAIPGVPPDGACAGVAMPADAYREPVTGSVTPRTPLFTWDPVAGARSYFVVISRDSAFTEVVEVGFTHRTAFVPRRTYADETTSYYWAVMPSPHRNGSCIFSQPVDGAVSVFEKRSVAPSPMGPAAGEAVLTQPVFRWTAAEGAQSYKIQVARDAEFRELLDNVQTASTAYASSTTYPVDTVLYWRVRATDGGNQDLNWSDTQTFRRQLPVPAVSPGNPTEGETIPLLSWEPVVGAVSYDLHVDQADGTTRDFTVASTRFTPTLFYGTGIWRWKVRANFPPNGNVSGGYFAPQEYVRRLNAPAAATVELGRDRVAFSWQPDQAASKYRLEVSTSDSFGSFIDTVTTPNTDYAPLLTQAGYRTGGQLYWRLAVVDAGGNVGAYKTGLVALPKALRLTTQGRLARGRRGRLKVLVKDARGRAVRGAVVRASGAGVRKARRRSNKRGVATFSLRARRKGTVTLTATRAGYRATTLRLAVR